MLIVSLFAALPFTHGAEVRSRFHSPDVPLRHWSYDAVHRLAVAGYVDMSLLGTKPYPRRDFARMTAQAMERARERKGDVQRDTERAQALLYRLMDEYREELIRLGVQMVRRDGEKIEPFHFHVADPVRAEFVGVITGDAVTGAPVVNGRRALFNPEGVLLENNRGWLLEDGANVRTQFRAWAAHDAWAAVSVDGATLWSGDEPKFQMQEAYLRAGIWNFDLLAGRESLWWGPGYHGALLLSDNARPMDMVRLSNRDPLRLPWVFGRLGVFRLNWFLARLEGDRNDFRHPLFNGMRMEWSLAPWMSFGVTRTIMLGGDGRNPSVSQYFKNLFLGIGENNSAGPLDPTNSDQKAGGDLRVRVPDLSRFIFFVREFELYAEVVGEDEADTFGITGPSNLAFLGGGFFPDIFGVSGLDLRLEWASNRVPSKPDVWYNHSIFTDGYTIRGRIIGHHMGTQGEDWFARLSQSFEDGSVIGAQLDIERHGVGFSNVETKYEGQMDFAYPVENNTQMGMFYRVQRYHNARNLIGATRTNHIFGLVMVKRF